MPKFDDYTQKTTPEDTDIALILDKTANVNKKTPFSGVWNWIVSKLTSAVISQLETTNKSIIPAINELNSNKFDCYKNGAFNLNELTDNGIYWITQAGSENLPVAEPGILIVRNTGNILYYIQIYVSAITASLYVRSCTNGIINSWHKFLQES